MIAPVKQKVALWLTKDATHISVRGIGPFTDLSKVVDIEIVPGITTGQEVFEMVMAEYERKGLEIAGVNG